MDPRDLTSELNILQNRFLAAEVALHSLEKALSDPDDGLAGVREPRRPLPSAPSASMTYA